MWHELVLHLRTARAGLPESVRLVVIGGEAASPARLAAWRELPGVDAVRLLNTYGATETALITHAVDLHGPATSVDVAGTVPIGRPLPHVVQRITAEGELLVGGPSVADGYPGLPEATAGRFVDIGDERFFSTGDLVRESADGVLDHLGRLDAQVKIRGIRVDPGEVEAQILRHRGVTAVAVTAVTVSDRTALAAYVVAAAGPVEEDASGLVADIRGFVRARAPAHLHPARITVVPALVLTPAARSIAGRPMSGTAHPPLSAPSTIRRGADDMTISESIARTIDGTSDGTSDGTITRPPTMIEIFRRVLEVDDVTDASDFFEAGGDSLLATRVLSPSRTSTTSS